jgi:hypothetical protein
MYDTASLIEAALILRAFQNRLKPPSTPVSPTPASKKLPSSPPTHLELPSRLRMNVTPTKKASKSILNAIGVQRNRFKRNDEGCSTTGDDASRASSHIGSSRDSSVKESSRGSSSKGNTQHQAETAGSHVPGMSDNETTPVSFRNMLLTVFLTL